MNQWRSPTAENVYARRPLLKVRSGGTSRKARHTVNASDMHWADIVFAMEQKHYDRLFARFARELKFKDVYVLDIPDNYRYMDPALIDEITATVDPVLSARRLE